MTFNMACKLHRIKQGATLEDVAKATGVSPQVVSFFETKRKSVNISVLKWYVDTGLNMKEVFNNDNK